MRIALQVVESTKYLHARALGPAVARFVRLAVTIERERKPGQSAEQLGLNHRPGFQQRRSELADFDETNRRNRD